MPKTIHGFPATPSAANGDELLIWRDANGDTKKITKGNLLAGRPMISGTPAGGRAASWSDANTVQDSGLLFADIYQKTDYYLVDKNFTVNAAFKRYNTIAGAMAVAAAGSTILVGPGTYTEDVTVSQANISLLGAGAPYFDGTNLIGGTIVKGRINCAGKRGVKIKNLGVDIRATGQIDAIAADAATVGATAIYQEFENLILIGKGSTAAPLYGHGILCATGGGNTIRNCKFYNWFHGVALRCSNSLVSDCYFYSCLSDAVVIKGDAGSGNAWNCSVTNCILDGDAASVYTRGGPIRIQNLNPGTTTRWITVSNISAKNGGEGTILIQQTAGVCANIAVSNVVSYNNGDHVSRADYDVDGATDVHFSNCMSSYRAAGWGMRVSATAARVRILGCNVDDTGAGAFTGIADYVDIGSGRPITKATHGHLGLDVPLGANLIRLGEIIAGSGQAAVGVAEHTLYLEWRGTAGGYSVIGAEITFFTQSGADAKVYSRRLVCVRRGATTLVAAVDTIGTDMVTSGGTQGTIAIAAYTGAANICTITVTASIADVAYTYCARVFTNTLSVWEVSNSAA
jgi:hypothetical protein